MIKIERHATKRGFKREVIIEGSRTELMNDLRELVDTLDCSFGEPTYDLYGELSDYLNRATERPAMPKKHWTKTLEEDKKKELNKVILGNDSE